MHLANFASRVLMPDFAQRLREARAARNITQARLASLLGVNPRVYNRWEQGAATPHFDTVVKIADILQLSLDELAGRADPATEVRFRNPQLDELCQQIDHLSDEDQHALVILMDSLVKRSQMTRLLSPARR